MRRAALERSGVAGLLWSGVEVGSFRSVVECEPHRGPHRTKRRNVPTARSGSGAPHAPRSGSGARSAPRPAAEAAIVAEQPRNGSGAQHAPRSGSGARSAPRPATEAAIVAEQPRNGSGARSAPPRNGERIP